MLSRRALGRLALSQGLVTLLGSKAFAQQNSVRIGYQKYGTLVLLKEKGFLDEALRPKGISVQWAQFPAGPPLLQAMIAGALDFGTTGDLPPVFAQASAPDALIYAGNENPTGSSEAIIVPQDSPIRTVSDLRGKRVAVTRGSDANWLLLASLRLNGLSLHDIKVSYLLPAAARPAFEAGQVDAWSIWDPYLSGALSSAGGRVRVLATGDEVGAELLSISRARDSLPKIVTCCAISLLPWKSAMHGRRKTGQKSQPCLPAARGWNLGWWNSRWQKSILDFTILSHRS